MKCVKCGKNEVSVAGTACWECHANEINAKREADVKARAHVAKLIFESKDHTDQGTPL